MNFCATRVSDTCEITCLDMQHGGGFNAILMDIEIPDAKKAKPILEKYLLPDKRITIVRCKEGKVQINLRDGKDLAQLLIDEGVALKTEKPKS